ncbi:MAG: hypothetical protein U0350_43480 [Caldilineaceae bacterium]
MTFHCVANPEISKLNHQRDGALDTVLNRFVTIGGVIRSEPPFRTLAVSIDKGTCHVTTWPNGRYRVEKLRRHVDAPQRYILTVQVDDDPLVRHPIEIAPAWAIWAPAYDVMVQRPAPVQPIAALSGLPAPANEMVVASGVIRSDPPFRSLSVRLQELTHRITLWPTGHYQLEKLRRDGPDVPQFTLVIQIDEDQPKAQVVPLQAKGQFVYDITIPRTPPTAPQASAPSQSPVATTSEVATENLAPTSTRKRAKKKA